MKWYPIIFYFLQGGPGCHPAQCNLTSAESWPITPLIFLPGGPGCHPAQYSLASAESWPKTQMIFLPGGALTV